MRKGSFSVNFLFSIRVVLKSGHILSKSTPITIYRTAQESLEEQPQP